MKRIKLNALAQAELRAIFFWIARESGSVDTAQSVLNGIQRRVNDIASSSFKIGTPVEELARSELYKIVHKRFVIYVRYPDPETLEVFTILWGGREAGRYFESLVKDPKK